MPRPLPSWLSVICLICCSLLVAFSGCSHTSPELSTAPRPTLASLPKRLESARTVRVVGTVYVRSTSGKSIPCDWEYAWDAQGRYHETLAILGCDDEKIYQYTVCDATRYMTVDDSKRQTTIGAVLPL